MLTAGHRVVVPGADLRRRLVLAGHHPELGHARSTTRAARCCPSWSSRPAASRTCKRAWTHLPLEDADPIARRRRDRVLPGVAAQRAPTSTYWTRSRPRPTASSPPPRRCAWSAAGTTSSCPGNSPTTQHARGRPAAAPGHRPVDARVARDCSRARCARPSSFFRTQLRRSAARKTKTSPVSVRGRRRRVARVRRVAARRAYSRMAHPPRRRARSRPPPAATRRPTRSRTDSVTTRPTRRRRSAARCSPPDGGPVDNRALEARPDVLVYTSEPLTDAVEVIGPVQATISVRPRRSSSTCSCGSVTSIRTAARSTSAMD